jgi:hypothetical protein
VPCPPAALTQRSCSAHPLGVRSMWLCPASFPSGVLTSQRPSQKSNSRCCAESQGAGRGVDAAAAAGGADVCAWSSRTPPRASSVAAAVHMMPPRKLSLAMRGGIGRVGDGVRRWNRATGTGGRSRRGTPAHSLPSPVSGPPRDQRESRTACRASLPYISQKTPTLAGLPRGRIHSPATAESLPVSFSGVGSAPTVADKAAKLATLAN